MPEALNLLQNISNDKLQLLLGLVEGIIAGERLTNISAAAPVINGILAADVKSELLLETLCGEYEEYIKANLSPAYSLSVKNGNDHLRTFFGESLPVKSIGPKEAGEFLLYLQKTVKRGYAVYFRNIRAEFNKACEWEYLEKNPFTKIKLPRKQKTAPAFIIKTELQKILAQIKHNGIREAVIYAFHTGCRIGEITNLVWKNVDLKNRTLTIGDDVYSTKTKTQRTVPMCDEVFELLNSMHERKHTTENDSASVLPLNTVREYVFAKENGEKYSNDFISKGFKEACRKARIDPKITFHHLRHSFASNLAIEGVSLYTIKTLLGHQSITTSEIYAHLNIAALRDAVKVFDTRKIPEQTEVVTPDNNIYKLKN